jgi:hypothetical protein
MKSIASVTWHARLAMMQNVFARKLKTSVLIWQRDSSRSRMRGWRSLKKLEKMQRGKLRN